MKAVNLGLSVMWGDCNMGANECYEDGDLFAWNEIVPEVHRLSALHTPVAIQNSMTSDLAEKIYGKGWQIPTKEQMLELMQNCEFEFALGGKAIMATGPNGNSIFLPLAGNRDWMGDRANGGFYWTSTAALEENDHAYHLRISDQITFGYNYIAVCQSVRPIYCPPQESDRKNYNIVKNPKLYTEVNFNYIKDQIENWCKELNIPYKLDPFQEVDRNTKSKVPVALYMQKLLIRKGNALGHGDITFVFAIGKKLIGLIIENSSKKYINSVKNCGMVYGTIYGSATFGEECPVDSIVKLKADDIYVRLY